MRRALLVAMFFVACQSSEAIDAGALDGGETDAGTFDAGEPAAGTPGAPVWYETTARLEISTVWHYDMPLPNGVDGSLCVSVTRAELTAEQIAYLDALRLKPFEENCSADGYVYDQIDTFDVDGGTAAYRSYACAGNALPGAQSLLPYGVYEKLKGAGTSCP